MEETSVKLSVVITGASSGIGAVYADRLARRGYPLILVARDASRLETLAARLRAEFGHSVEVVVADLTDAVQASRLASRLREDAAIGGLINNAGVGLLGTLLDSESEGFEAALELNVLAFTRLATAAAAGLAARGQGFIVNIASVLALAPERAHPVYAGSKAYVLAFTQSLHQQVSTHGVRLQVVLPGATRTEIFDRAGGSVDSIPKERVMEAADLVDAALAGFDQGELVTIPSLPDVSDWEAFDQARLRLGPNLSRNRPAERYAETVQS